MRNVYLVINEESDFEGVWDHIDSIWTSKKEAMDRAMVGRDGDSRKHWHNRRTWRVDGYRTNSPGEMFYQATLFYDGTIEETGEGY